MEDDSADSKLSKSGPADPPANPDELREVDELYQSGCGATCPVLVSYFFAHCAATPAATAYGM
jgi:hypothetical protein